MSLGPVVRGAAAVALFGACATMANGTTQQIGFTSSPSRAKVTIDGQPAGFTPLVATLERRGDHRIRIELEDFQPYEAVLSRTWSGWAWANVANWGIGLIVDAVSGGLYNLTPDLITGQLAKASASDRQPGGDAFYIVLVQHADSGWTKVGALRR